MVRQLTCPEGPTILDVVMVRKVGTACANPRAGANAAGKATTPRVAADPVRAGRMRVSPPPSTAPRRRYRA
jgi:hypothetical protein